MLEWNAFIKPLVYVVELVFAAVVTVGTADKLLFEGEGDEGLRCALDDSIGACSAVIVLGALCMIGGFYILWKRLSSVFMCDMKYRNDTECAMCLLLSIGWLVIASLVTAFREIPPGVARDFLGRERRVTITFSWLLWVFHIGSMAIAWFAPDEDDYDEQFEGINADTFAGGESFEFALQSGTMPNLWNTGSGDDFNMPLPDTPQATSLQNFLEQHDEIEVASFSDLRRRDTIQDVTSQWKHIVQADLDSESIVDEPPSILRRPTTPAGASEASSSSQPPPTLRRRTVRFPDTDLHND